MVAVGIDLGTTNSEVAMYHADVLEVVHNPQGNNLTPSVVQIKDKTVQVGKTADDNKILFPESVIYDAKRLIGRSIHEESIKQFRRRWQFGVKADEENNPLISVVHNDNETDFKPEQISAFVLERLKYDVLRRLQLDKDTKIQAVVTVPAYFNQRQREATMNACTIAGLECNNIINEPTAAALCHVNKYYDQRQKHMMVIDLGGGTFDVALLEVQGRNVKVIAKQCDLSLGGQDITNCLFDYCKQQIQTTINGKNQKKTEARLLAECERVKQKLSIDDKTTIQLDISGEEFEHEISRDQFNMLTKTYIDRCINKVRAALEEAYVNSQDVDQIVLAGGATRMPILRERVQQLFGKAPFIEDDPDLMVAKGAAIYANMVQGSAGGQIQEFKLQDVTPLGIGVEVQGQLMSIIIPKNTAMPSIRERCFATTADDQQFANIKLYEGQRMFVTDNVLLGDFMLHGIPAGKAKSQLITVVLEINKNSMIQVTATINSNGQSLKLRVQSKGLQMTEDEVSELCRKAKYYQEQDVERREVVNEMKLVKEQLYRLKKVIQQKRDLITDDQFDEYGQMAQGVLEWLKSNPDSTVTLYRQKLQAIRNIVDQINAF